MKYSEGKMGRVFVLRMEHKDKIPTSIEEFCKGGLFAEAHEVLATGFLAPGEEGNPMLHIHGALGRDGKTRTGCLRPGIDTWLVGEVIINEILNLTATRKYDKESKFNLLVAD